MQRNPMQMMQQLKDYMTNYRGNPEQEARQMIAQAGLDQKQLNDLQKTANMIYGMAQMMGFIK